VSTLQGQAPRAVVLNRTRNFHPDHRAPLRSDEIDPVEASILIHTLTEARTDPLTG
jgi:hypothetical protein